MQSLQHRPLHGEFCNFWDNCLLLRLVIRPFRRKYCFSGWGVYKMQCVHISLYVTDAQTDVTSNVLSKTSSPSHAQEWLIYPIFMYLEYLPLWKESMLSSAECTERFVYEEPPCVDSALWPGLNQLISLMSNRNAIALTRKEMSKWNMQVGYFRARLEKLLLPTQKMMFPEPDANGYRNVLFLFGMFR